MNELIQNSFNAPTMSSREIAELCDKEHRNVLRDIDNLNETYEKMGLLKIEQGYYTTPNTGNQQYREYLLTKEQCIDLITGYRADVRIRINRRWQELEQANTPTDQLIVAQIGLLNRVLDEFGDKISPQARETLLLVGSEKFLGISTGYRPPVTQQTYSAGEIGERLGISGNKVGRLTKAHNLKTEEYGIWVLDQSAHSSKQVTNFRYYEDIIPVLKALIQTAL